MRLRPQRIGYAVAAAVALGGTVAGVVATGASGTNIVRHATGRVASHRPGSAAGGALAAATGGSTARSGGGGHGQPQVRSRAGASGRRAPKVLRTSCQSVAHIGDSTSVDLVSAAFLPDQAQRLPARYASVGVKHLRVDASGGRSIVEALPGQVNGYSVASAWRAQGYRGCWVFALGTNDTANVTAGSSVSMMARIDRMMAVAHGQPVLWVNTRTLLTGGAWANAGAQRWNQTLIRALGKYPNMRIFNWSAVAQPGWFLPDGIHYNTRGCALRAKAIADALARAFPVNGASKGRIVS